MAQDTNRRELETLKDQLAEDSRACRKSVKIYEKYHIFYMNINIGIKLMYHVKCLYIMVFNLCKITFLKS